MSNGRTLILSRSLSIWYPDRPPRAPKSASGPQELVEEGSGSGPDPHLQPPPPSDRVNRIFSLSELKLTVMEVGGD